MIFSGFMTWWDFQARYLESAHTNSKFSIRFQSFDASKEVLVVRGGWSFTAEGNTHLCA